MKPSVTRHQFLQPTDIVDAGLSAVHLAVGAVGTMPALEAFETEEGCLLASDLNSARRFETLAGMLLERGPGETGVEKILGGNLVRVFNAAWD